MTLPDSDDQRNGGDPLGYYPQLSINVRPMATPLPLGLFSFGIGMLLVAAQTGHRVPAAEDRQLGFVLATFVFPLEFLAAIVAYLQTVWPVFRRGLGREAIEGSLTEQLDRARAEAGVRQQR